MVWHGNYALLTAGLLQTENPCKLLILREQDEEKEGSCWVQSLPEWGSKPQY